MKKTLILFFAVLLFSTVTTKAATTVISPQPKNKGFASKVIVPVANICHSIQFAVCNRFYVGLSILLMIAIVVNY